MMAMGYFRAPRKLYGRKPEREQQRRESLSAALLVDEGEAAAAAGAVPKGYFAVYVGAEARRFVVPTSYLRQPAFRELMERAAEEFGFDQAGGLRIPCREEDFEATVAALEKSRRGGGGGARARGPAAGPTRWARCS
jgi:SAUR family protein